jgi:hypothetical protein
MRVPTLPFGLNKRYIRLVSGNKGLTSRLKQSIFAVSEQVKQAKNFLCFAQ